MEKVPAYDINQYLTDKKDIYQLLTDNDYNYHLPTLNSNSLSVDILLGLGNDVYWCLKKSQITKVSKHIAKGVDKIYLYDSIKQITGENMGYNYLRLPPKQYLVEILFSLKLNHLLF